MFLGREFDFDKFNSEENSYKATEEVIEIIRETNGIQSYKHNDAYEFLFNERYKTAVLLKCAAKFKEEHFTGKRNKRAKNKFDIGNRIISTVSARIEILHFLNSKYKAYSIVIPIGGWLHEACLFFRNHDNFMHAVYYNPNYSDVTDGVESSKIGNQLLKSFHHRLNCIQAYHSLTGNVESACSAYVWMEIYNHVCNGFTPFGNEDIGLESYNSLLTEHSSKKYRGKIALKHFSIWKNLDSKLRDDLDDQDLLDITYKISNVISDHFSKI